MKIICLLLTLCALAIGPRSAEARERYEVHWRQQTRVNPPGSDTKSDPQWVISLRDNLRQKTLWRQTVVRPISQEPEFVWSRDHRALVVSDTTRFWVWRAGYRLRSFRAPSDYMMGFAWSPDNRRLLARSDGSGATDLDYGGLYCLELGAWPRYKIFRVGEARSFGWDSPTKIRFTEMDEKAMNNAGNQGMIFRMSHWRVPRTSMFARRARR